ncbi:MAG: hypothetical protein U0572_10045 [Phycisphaerales bacterium]
MNPFELLLKKSERPAPPTGGTTRPGVLSDANNPASLAEPGFSQKVMGKGANYKSMFTSVREKASQLQSVNATERAATPPPSQMAGFARPAGGASRGTSAVSDVTSAAAGAPAAASLRPPSEGAPQILKAGTPKLAPFEGAQSEARPVAANAKNTEESLAAAERGRTRASDSIPKVTERTVAKSPPDHNARDVAHDGPAKGTSGSTAGPDFRGMATAADDAKSLGNLMDQLMMAPPA